MEKNQEKNETSGKVENVENVEKVENVENEENFKKPSYTYWKRESDKPFSNEFIPQKSITTIENNNKAGSAWNKAGTW